MATDSYCCMSCYWIDPGCSVNIFETSHVTGAKIWRSGSHMIFASLRNCSLLHLCMPLTAIVWLQKSARTWTKLEFQEANDTLTPVLQRLLMAGARADMLDAEDKRPSLQLHTVMKGIVDQVSWANMREQILSIAEWQSFLTRREPRLMTWIAEWYLFLFHALNFISTFDLDSSLDSCDSLCHSYMLLIHFTVIRLIPSLFPCCCLLLCRVPNCHVLFVTSILHSWTVLFSELDLGAASSDGPNDLSNDSGTKHGTKQFQ